jgi:hypothetical protein
MAEFLFVPIYTIAIGIGATVTFDLWGQFLRIAFKIAPSNICLVGRWVLSMRDGVVRHSTIITAPPKRGECVAGWIVHYLTGIVFAALFLFAAGPAWVADPTVIPAVGYGIVTVLAPFLIMQPLFGFGVAASKTPNPGQSQFRSIMNHTAFGAGLYLTAVMINYIFAGQF